MNAGSDDSTGNAEDPDRPSFGWKDLVAWWPFLVAGFALAGFFALGETYLGGYVLDLGSGSIPTPRYAMFIFSWTTFGSIAVLFLALGILARFPQPSMGVMRENRLVLFLAAMGFLLPTLIRQLVLGGAPLTDDESCYRFSAQLLASGRLTVPSHPLKLFFDNVFMINDGRLFPQYFWGWPALLAPGVWLHATGFMNAFYSTLTVFPLYYGLRRLAGRSGATVAVILFLASPMLMIGAATGLSHTTCLMALTYAFWFLVILRDEEAPVWASAGLAIAFCVAFFIRPITAIGLGAPMLAAFWFQVRARSSKAFAHAAGFLIPALVLGMLFLAVNKVTNHGFLRVGYTHYWEYAKSNGFRFSFWSHDPGAVSSPASLPGVGEAITRTGVAVLRLGTDLLGWPISFFLLLPIAGFTRANRVMWASLVCFLVIGCFMQDAGVDSYGPVHYTEMALPVLVLLALAYSRAERWLTATRLLPERWNGRSLPTAVLLALVVTTAIGFWPVRIRTIGRIAENINSVDESLAANDIHNAIIFAPHPFHSQIPIAPTRHFVFWRPTNDPDLKNDILWVNDLTPDLDKKLMPFFPARRGYIMFNNASGKPLFIPLEMVAK
jgi:hypothetical protein